MPTVDPLARWRLLIKEMGGSTTAKSLTTPYGVASTDLLTSTGHGLAAGDRVQFYSLTGGTGLATGTVYRVSATGLTADDFKVADMDTGSIINFTTDITAGTFYQVGAANKISLTINSTTNVYRQSTTTGFISPYPHDETIAAGGPYAVEGVVIPYNSANATGGSFYKFLEGPKVGGLVSYWTNSLGYGSITVNTEAAFDRGPGETILTLEYPAAHSAGASLNYNAPGELHFTLLADDANAALIRPKRQHYVVEFYNGSTWDEVYAGMVWDFEATDTEVVFYGIDYLGLLGFVWDERFDPTAPKKPAPTGSYYTSQTISALVTAHLTWATGLSNSLVSFLAVGAIGTMSETVEIASTMQSALDFVVGLLNSHKAGTGKMTRLSVQKVAGVYTLQVAEDPGSHKDDLALNYVAGGLAQGYKAIPFGSDWASRVNLIGRSRDGTAVLYRGDDSGVDQNTWGKIGQAPIIVESRDQSDINRRARQAALDASKLGRQIGIGLKLGSFRPLQAFDLCDQVPVVIDRGVVVTREWGSDVFGADPSGDPAAVEALYWSITGLIWESYDDGHWETVLTLWPVGGGAALPTGVGPLQTSWQFVGYGYQYATLDAAPNEGSLLVAFLFTREGDITTVGDTWTLQTSAVTPDYNYHGFDPAYMYCYSRVAGAGEDAVVLALAGIGSGGSDGVYVYLMEWPVESVPSQATTEIGGYYSASETLTMALSTADGWTGTMIGCILGGRQGYFDPEPWTPVAGTTELIDATAGMSPGIWIGSDIGGGALSVGATAYSSLPESPRPYALMYVLITTGENFSDSLVVQPQTPLSAGNGPPAADNTSSETYIDLATGQQYVRNDATDTWDLVPDTRVPTHLWKQPVRVATTTAGTLATSYENGDTVDGVVLATGDRILVKDLTAGAGNGIRVVGATGTPARADDAATSGELVGLAVLVLDGDANANRVFINTNTGTITVDTTVLTFTELVPGVVNASWDITYNGDGTVNTVTRAGLQGAAVTTVTWAGGVATSIVTVVGGPTVTITPTYSGPDVVSLTRVIT